MAVADTSKSENVSIISLLAFFCQGLKELSGMLWNDVYMRFQQQRENVLTAPSFQRTLWLTRHAVCCLCCLCLTVLQSCDKGKEAAFLSHKKSRICMALAEVHLFSANFHRLNSRGWSQRYVKHNNAFPHMKQKEKLKGYTSRRWAALLNMRMYSSLMSVFARSLTRNKRVLPTKTTVCVQSSELWSNLFGMFGVVSWVNFACGW